MLYNNFRSKVGENMEYIIKNNSYRLLKQKLNELMKDIDKDNITYFDLTENKIEEILEECNYNSLFNELKGIVVYNANIFSAKYEYKEELEKLENYLNNPNQYTTLIFVTDSVSLKKKCAKVIKDKGNYFELEMPKDNELSDKIKEYLSNNNYKIESSAINELINNLDSNYDYILNELDKIIVVKKDYVITKEDIDKYTIKLEKDNIFDFVDCIIEKDDKKMYKYLDKFINEKNEPAILFSNVATQYRLIYASKNLIKQGYSEKDIATEFDVHPYRIKLAIQNSYNYTNTELKEKLLYLGELDEKIKLGMLDKYVALKLFLVNI